MRKSVTVFDQISVLLLTTLFITVYTYMYIPALRLAYGTLTPPIHRP